MFFVVVVAINLITLCYISFSFDKNKNKTKNMFTQFIQVKKIIMNVSREQNMSFMLLFAIFINFFFIKVMVQCDKWGEERKLEIRSKS